MKTSLCEVCNRTFVDENAVYQHQRHKHGILPRKDEENDAGAPDFEGECSVCGASPVHPLSGMCGPCTFGEADTVGGNW